MITAYSWEYIKCCLVELWIHIIDHKSFKCQETFSGLSWTMCYNGVLKHILLCFEWLSDIHFIHQNAGIGFNELNWYLLSHINEILTSISRINEPTPDMFVPIWICISHGDSKYGHEIPESVNCLWNFRSTLYTTYRYASLVARDPTANVQISSSTLLPWLVPATRSRFFLATILWELK